MTIELQTATMDYTNPEYLEPSAFVRVSRKSRNSSPAFSAFLPFIKDIPPEMEVSIHDIWYLYDILLYDIRRSAIR